MTHPLTIEDFIYMAAERNHILFGVENTRVPSQGKLTIHCNVCDKAFTTSARSYKNARKSGCTNCKAINARLQTRSEPPVLTAEQQIERLERATQAVLNRRELQAAYNHISNRDDLRMHLIREDNEYSNFILSMLDNESSRENETECSQIHHIIPRHAGGPDSQWNLIRLSRQNHVRAHEIRFQTYREEGDFNFLRSVPDNSLVTDELAASRLESNRRGNQTRRLQQSGIYAPGASSAGGRASAAISSVQRDYSHQRQMSESVRTLFYETGSRWRHSNTNTLVNFSPRDVITLTQLKEKLAQALPEQDVDRLSLTNAPRNNNVTSNLSKVIRGERRTAYGWELLTNQSQVDSG